MSADNWRICPACSAKSDAKVSERKKAAEKSYGKVPAEQYLKNIADANAGVTIEETMREDWDIGMDTSGNFSVSYCCSCNECGFSFEFKTEKKAPLS